MSSNWPTLDSSAMSLSSTPVLMRSRSMRSLMSASVACAVSRSPGVGGSSS